MSDLLSNMLALPSQPLIAIVGAGGKTMTMFTLAAELARQGKRVVSTTTTNIYIPARDETEAVIIEAETSTMLQAVRGAWQQYHHVTVGGSFVGSEKVGAVQPEQPYELLIHSGADAVIVEADGARHRMIKAPAEYEPVIPLHTNVALVVMSAEAINQPLAAVIAHRPERIAAILNIEQGDILTPQRIATLLTSPFGALKNIDKQAIIHLLITHVYEDRRSLAQQLASWVKREGRFAQVLGSSKPDEWLAL